ncbi:hypothetical protein CNECB9_4140022 [Cupriavidus necator]|uniref:Uncharacterized protein n=1 Tax=Cupriavidus necator TaxID=106590 RepID=A0A1K0JFD4_CUPNE|nr:hypothetical protein CNECB9_4140022 [Cupriavidus necator]
MVAHREVRHPTNRIAMAGRSAKAYRSGWKKCQGQRVLRQDRESELETRTASASEAALWLPGRLA